jgi:DNA-binding response OmpR family regulator
LVANLVRAVLRKHGYQIVVTSTREAAELIGHSEKKKLLITNSPQSFLEFADRVPLLYLTSAPDHELRSAFAACRVVHKPFTPQELLDGVQALVAAGYDW